MKKTLNTLLALTLVALLALGSVSIAESADVDWTLYPETFEAWTGADLTSYLKAKGCITDQFYYLQLSQGDLDGLKLADGFIYMDIEGATVMVNCFIYDPANEESAALLADAVANKAIVIDGNPVSNLDAVLNKFAFSYMNGIDDQYIISFGDALKELAAHYEYTPEFILDLPQ